MLLSRIVLGVGSGVFVVTSYVTAANLEPVGRQAGAMSNVSMGFSASLVLGVPIGRFVAASYDWKVIFWGIGYSIPHLRYVVKWWSGERHSFRIRHRELNRL
ncbi:MFS transporter [Brevibacillus choshinensis]|uniref:MFS transporter n=1 Tax=Brevibacillus choshinensis TaxID=54911 RepID=UPI002E1D20CD|nr:MFS transporter [Brevibacillus choshinensis]MED4585845.1 MFS transporter [Brevibacillus choshinensis]